MSTFNYGEMQAVSDDLIFEFGAAGSILAMGQPDELNGGDLTAITYPCRLVIVAYDARYVNGSSIMANDVQIFISANGLAVEPQVGMQVSAGGKVYLIVSIDPNRFDGETPVVYVAQGRIN